MGADLVVAGELIVALDLLRHFAFVGQVRIIGTCGLMTRAARISHSLAGLTGTHA